MEDRIYKNNLEQFLKETADDFRMVPSRKVWHSIYNNMHPDRKWPSMAICLLILTAWMYIGVSGNNSISIAARRAVANNLSEMVISQPNKPTKETQPTNSTPAFFTPSLLDIPSPINTLKDLVNDESKYRASLTDISLVNKTAEKKLLIAVETESNSGVNEKADIFSRAPKMKLNLHVGSANDNEPLALNAKNTNGITPSSEEAIMKIVAGITKDGTVPADDKKTIRKEIKSIPNMNDVAADKDREWKENDIFKNKPAFNKFTQNTSVSYYIAPAVGYRSLSKIREGNLEALNFQRGITANTVTAYNENIVDDRALNLEAGLGLLYKLSDKFLVKSGIQFNYTNYISHATGTGHPTETYIAVRDPYNASRPSEYLSKDGSDRLNRTTAQVSVPIGFDYKIAGNAKLKWYVGSSLQPTYVLSGSAYVLSADSKNYIAEKSLLRSWNLNSSIETFLSLKPSSGVTFNLGPQLRYQILSTYKKDYNYSEKLYNLGVKIGLTTHL